MFSLLLLSAMATAPGWHDASAIVISPALTQPAYVRLVLPQSIDGGPSGEYGDLRVAGEGNREVPYALDADPAAAAGTPVALSDVGFVKGQYTQAVADLGTSGALHSTIVLFTSLPTFFERVEIATSDDRRTWAVVKTDGPIYRVAQNDDAGTSAIEFGPSRARWLRIRVLDPNRLFPITGASVTEDRAPPRLVRLAATAKTSADSTKTIATFDFGTPYANLAAVAFETRTPAFSRNVAFAVSDGAKSVAGWAALDDASISRFASGLPVLTAKLGNVRTRLLRVTIDNGNDAPLAALRITPLGYEHHIVFRAEPGVAYRLLWNAEDATPPVYDLAARLAHESWRAGAVARLGGAASTAFVPATPAAPPAPWLQQAALPIALVLGCLVIGAIGLFALRAKNAA